MPEALAREASQGLARRMKLHATGGLPHVPHATAEAELKTTASCRPLEACYRRSRRLFPVERERTQVRHTARGSEPSSSPSPLAKGHKGSDQPSVRLEEFEAFKYAQQVNVPVPATCENSADTKTISTEFVEGDSQECV